jgi:hypothetical protein
VKKWKIFEMPVEKPYGLREKMWKKVDRCGKVWKLKKQPTFSTIVDISPLRGMPSATKTLFEKRVLDSQKLLFSLLQCLKLQKFR